MRRLGITHDSAYPDQYRRCVNAESAALAAPSPFLAQPFQTGRRLRRGLGMPGVDRHPERLSRSHQVIANDAALDLGAVNVSAALPNIAQHVVQAHSLGCLPRT